MDRRVDQIPVIDVSALVAEETTDDELADVAAEIDRACRHTGFFLVAGHGIAPGHLAALDAAARALHAVRIKTSEALACHRAHRPTAGACHETSGPERV